MPILSSPQSKNAVCQDQGIHIPPLVSQMQYTVWFKINLTLFLKLTFLTNGITIIIYLKIFINHDILGGCGESGIKIDAQILKQEPFSDKQSKTNLHTP